jgi:hypothetical protein
MFANDRYDSGRSFSIPKGRAAVERQRIVQNRLSGGENAIRIHSDDLIRPMLNRSWAFRIFT